MYGDKRCANSCRYVHRATITTDNHIGSLQEGNELGQARLAGQVEGVLAQTTRYKLDKRQVVGGSCQNYLSV